MSTYGVEQRSAPCRAGAGAENLRHAASAAGEKSSARRTPPSPPTICDQRGGAPSCVRSAVMGSFVIITVVKQSLQSLDFVINRFFLWNYSQQIILKLQNIVRSILVFLCPAHCGPNTEVNSSQALRDLFFPSSAYLSVIFVVYFVAQLRIHHCPPFISFDAFCVVWISLLPRLCHFCHAFLFSFCTFGLFCTRFLRVWLCFFLSVCSFYSSTCLLPELVNKDERLFQIRQCCQ